MQAITIVMRHSSGPYLWTEADPIGTPVSADSWHGMVRDLVEQHTTSCRNDGAITVSTFDDDGYRQELVGDVLEATPGAVVHGQSWSTPPKVGLVIGTHPQGWYQLEGHVWVCWEDGEISEELPQDLTVVR